MQYRESQMENSTLTTNKETACDDMSLENHNMDLETTKNRKRQIIPRLANNRL